MRRVCHDLKTKNISTLGFPGGIVVKHVPDNARDEALILGSGRSPGVRNGNPVFLEGPGKIQSTGLQRTEHN